MKSLKKEQSGFSSLEIVLIIVIVAMVAFVGYYVYKANKNANNTYKSANNIANSQAPKFKPNTTTKTTTK